MLIAGFNKKIVEVATEVRDKDSRVYSLVQWGMAAIKVVQTFTKEEEEHRRFMGASREAGVPLSEGEKQRITIARALLRDAPILILDEPTSALDVATEALVMAAIETLMHGRTNFIIAHRLSTVRRCDHIMVLCDGIIAEQGGFAELLRRGGIFAEYYQTQFAIRRGGRRRNRALVLRVKPGVADTQQAMLLNCLRPRLVPAGIR